MQLYNTVASRNLIRAEMEFLKHAEPIMVLNSFGMSKEQPLKATDTITFRRTKPFNADSNEVPNVTPSSLQVSEGVTPTTSTISFTDVSVTLKKYSVLYKFSDKMELMYEDNVIDEMKDQVGEAIGECCEKITYGQVKAGSNVLYANGSSRAAVNSAISLDDIRRAARSIMSNRGRMITKRIKPGPNYGTTGVEPGWLVFCHTDGISDVRDLPGFVPAVEYGSMQKMHDREFGAVEDFRFIASPLFEPHLAGGAVVGSTGMKSADSTNIDVYPYVVISADCFAHVSLKGGKKKTGISPTFISSKEKNAANPAGQFGFVGGDVWYAAVRLNENWMTRIEAAVKALT